MTPLTFNTPDSTTNVMMAMPIASSVSKNTNDRSSYITYSANPKNWYRKTTAKRSSFDWDVFMNELEFE